MLIYFIKRFALALLTILSVSFLSVALLSINTVTDLDVLKNKNFMTSDSPMNTPSPSNQIKKGILINYMQWLKKAVHFDFGNSLIFNVEVSSLVLQKAFITAPYFLVSVFFILFFSVIITVFKVFSFSSFANHASNSVLLFLNMTPIYILAIFLLMFFSGHNHLNLFPLGGRQSDNFNSLALPNQFIDRLYFGFLPVFCYVLSHLAEVTFITQNSTTSILKKEYIKTAIAKGLSKKDIIVHHVLRNSILPLLSYLNTLVLLLISSSLIVENVFNIKGLGYLSFRVIINRDYNTLIFINLLTAFFLIGLRCFSDLCLHFLDRRIDWGD
ncbi:MAG: ABC transporter permease [Deltaproteobacteria bacterium]|nr:ABC transporter permease [Deltaproteobacteria bacterium]